jgi:hypothetical protein
MMEDGSINEQCPGREGTVEPISYELSRSRSGLRERMPHPFVELAWVSIIVVAISFAMQYAGFGGMLAVITLVVIAAITYHRSSQTTAEPRADTERLVASVPFARLTLRGHRNDIEKVTPPDNVAFEPIIFERVYAGTSLVRLFGLGIFLGVVLMIIIEAWLPVPRNTGAIGGLYQVLGVLFLWLISRLFPTYYRIMPGRLDIMRFAPLTNRVRKMETVNLRSAKIRVVLERATIVIRNHDNEHTIILRGLTEPFRFIDALLMGAVSTHRPAAVPDDRLMD